MFKKLICKLIGHHIYWLPQSESYKLTSLCRRCGLISSKANKVKVIDFPVTRRSYVTRDANKLSLPDHYASISDALTGTRTEPETVQVDVVERGEY